MRWSKTKKLVESLLADKLQNRLEIHITNYNVSVGEQRRVWITFDKKEIFNASTANFLKEHDALWNEIQANTDLAFPDDIKAYCDEVKGKDIPDEDLSMYVLEARGIFNPNRLYNVFVEYPQMSYADIQASMDNLVLTLMMVDKRFGKRSLKSYIITDKTHPLIKQMYAIRCEAESILTL